MSRQAAAPELLECHGPGQSTQLSTQLLPHPIPSLGILYLEVVQPVRSIGVGRPLKGDDDPISRQPEFWNSFLKPNRACASRERALVSRCFSVPHRVSGLSVPHRPHSLTYRPTLRPQFNPTIICVDLPETYRFIVFCPLSRHTRGSFVLL